MLLEAELDKPILRIVLPPALVGYDDKCRIVGPGYRRNARLIERRRDQFHRRLHALGERRRPLASGRRPFQEDDKARPLDLLVRPLVHFL